MNDIARLPAGGKPPAITPHVRVPTETLRTLARRVERLGLAGRFDPESAFAAREELAHQLRRLAAGSPA